MSWRRLPVLIFHRSSLANNFFFWNSTCSVTFLSSHWSELPTKQILLWYRLAEVLQPSLQHTLLKLTISYVVKAFTVAKKEIPSSVSLTILLTFPSLWARLLIYICWCVLRSFYTDLQSRKQCLHSGFGQIAKNFTCLTFHWEMRRRVKKYRIFPGASDMLHG